MQITFFRKGTGGIQRQQRKGSLALLSKESGRGESTPSFRPVGLAAGCEDQVFKV
jgi:hypothetical protein